VHCILCKCDRTDVFSRVYNKVYLKCDNCDLVFLSPDYHPNPIEEYSRYATHNNNPHDLRYRRFLNRLAQPLSKCLSKGDTGLDYGSGPGPTLSLMLTEQEFPTQIYDPFFATDKKVLESSYDFITCTEAIEHFFNPAKEFELLNSILNPQGYLGIMTDIFYQEIDFDDWYYHKDFTHVGFYSLNTIKWIAEHFGWSWESPRRNVIIFKK